MVMQQQQKNQQAAHRAPTVSHVPTHRGHRGGAPFGKGVAGKGADGKGSGGKGIFGKGCPGKIANVPPCSKRVP